MKLTKEDIEKTEEIGKCEKGSVLHILTKGGLSMIVKKSLGGAMEVISSAPHPGIARFRAEQIDKSIQWVNNLFKSETEEMYSLEKAKVFGISEDLGKDTDPEQKKLLDLEAWSTPENHYKYAQNQSHLAGRQTLREETSSASAHDKNMRILMHTDDALKHYKMAGLDHAKAMEEHKKNMKSHGEIDHSFKAPANSYDLELAYRRKAKKEGKTPPQISGLGYNWSE